MRFLDVRFSKKSPDDGAAKGDEYALEGGDGENQSNSRGAFLSKQKSLKAPLSNLLVKHQGPFTRLGAS